MFARCLTVAAVVVALAASGASAQGFRDAGAKMRGEFGGTPRRSTAAPMYRYSAPVVVQTPVAPPAVAQAPQQRRSYSVEPAPQPQAAPPCPHHQAQAPPAPQQGAQTYRRYSVEPGMAAPAYVPYYGAPRGNRVPSYMLSKTDPRRYSR